MDINSAYLKPGGQRKNVNSGSKLRLTLLDDEEALNHDRRGGGVSRMSDGRKRLRLEQQRRRRLQLLAKNLANHGDLRKNTLGKSWQRRGPGLGRVPAQAPAGAMAPCNTTQYLMENVYSDMADEHEEPAAVASLPAVMQYAQSPSPHRVYAALDTYYESFLSYQQKDFEETFPLCWEPC